MKVQDKKAAIAAYRERKVVAGIYVVRCPASGQRWVGRASDLSTVQNRLWFTLRYGRDAHSSIQAAWRTHGANALVYEEIERIADDLLDYQRDLALKARLAHWCAQLRAEAI